jgi:ABC-type glycerol-3-phosphate transport system substrate-binding protein
LIQRTNGVVARPDSSHTSSATGATEAANVPGTAGAFRVHPFNSRRGVCKTLAGSVALPGILLAAACGSTGKSGEQVPIASAAPVELAAWTWVAGADKQQQIQTLSDGVTAQAPNVTARWAFQGPGDGASALEKLLIAMAGGTPPEVSMMQEAWIPQIGTESTLLVLDPFLKQSKFDLNDFIPAARAYMQFGDGKVRYLPWYFSPVALFNNTASYKESGLTKAPQKWDDIVEYGRKIVRAEGDRVTRSGVDLGANDWHWLPLLWGNGAEFAKDGKIVQNSPQGVETLQWLVDLVRRHRVMGKPAPTGGFDAGNVGLQIFGSWNIKAKRSVTGLDFETALIPSKAGGPAPHPVRMEGLMAFSKKDKDDATWRFLNFLTSPETSVEYSIQHGYQVPARTSARKGKVFSEQIVAEPTLKAPVEGMDSASARPMPLVRGWVQIKGLIAKMISEAQDGQRSSKVILDEYTQQFQQLASV